MFILKDIYLPITSILLLNSARICNRITNVPYCREYVHEAHIIVSVENFDKC